MISKQVWLRRIAGGYVTVIRNTPILVLILFTYFRVCRSCWACASARSRPSSSRCRSMPAPTSTEVFRGALLALARRSARGGARDRPDRAADAALDHHSGDVRNALPALSNNFISLFKDTSLAAAIAVPELTFYARQINVHSFRIVETWLVASLMYVDACYLHRLRPAPARTAPGDPALTCWISANSSSNSGSPAGRCSRGSA